MYSLARHHSADLTACCVVRVDPPVLRYLNDIDALAPGMSNGQSKVLILISSKVARAPPSEEANLFSGSLDVP